MWQKTYRHKGINKNKGNEILRAKCKQEDMWVTFCWLQHAMREREHFASERPARRQRPPDTSRAQTWLQTSTETMLPAMVAHILFHVVLMILDDIF